jgi:PAS domain S-box-containing protein
MTSSVLATPRPEPLSILLQASSMLLHATSEQELLSQTLDLASRLLVADAYGVWRDSGDGNLWCCIAERGIAKCYPRSGVMNPEMFRQGVWMIEDVLTDPRAVFSREVYAAANMRSVLIVPWMVGDVLNGAIVYYWSHSRKFPQEDVDYALALSNLSASALNRIELSEQRRLEEQRLAFLAEASALLSASLDYESTLDRVARLAVSEIAEWCTVHVTENGEAQRIATAYADPAMDSFALEYARKYPERITPESGVGKVLLTGEAEIIPHITEDMVAAAAEDEDHLQLLRQMKLSASIVVPLQSQGKILGAIRLLGTGGHYFTPGDVRLALDLGRRAAIAIENAQLHRSLVEQESELRLSHAAAKMGSWSWDPDRKQLYWSPEFKALHGIQSDVEPTLELSYELVHPEDRDRARSDFWAAVESEATVFNSDHRSLTPDGRLLWLQVRGRIRRNQDGSAAWVAGLIIDVTDLHLAEEALRRAEKLAAAGRLAATVAHEVNNPLACLVNLIYLAQHVDGVPAETVAHLRAADAELRRIAHIVRQTLGFYRESASAQPTEITTLVSDVLDLYRSRGMARGLTLIAPPNAEELCATVIAGEIKQVVANLIANAIDATPPGGTVHASVRRRKEGRKHGFEIAVSDTGCGISEANRDRLFEPFFTTKEDVGTGLGLWVSKGIVEKHGGSILIDDPAAIGTTIRVRLPLHPSTNSVLPASA